MDTTLVTNDHSLRALTRSHLATSGRSRWGLVLALAVPTLWIDLYVVARLVDTTWAWGAAVAGQTLAALLGQSLLRRAAAGDLLENDRSNRWAGHALGALHLLPFSVYASEHVQARAGSRREDGSAWALDPRPCIGFAVDAGPERRAGYGSWMEATRILAGERHLETYSRSTIRAALVSVLWCAWMATIVAVGLRLDAMAWLLCWAIPLLASTIIVQVIGRVSRGRHTTVDRTTYAFEVVPTARAQEIVPASRSWVISARS